MHDSDEEWKPVVGFEDYVLVSSLGRMRRIRMPNGRPLNRIIHGFIPSHGYLTIDLVSRPIRVRRLVHRLVAEAFLGPIPHGYQVNHVNGDKTDNSVVNLQYVTHLENMRHAHRIGLMRTNKGRKGDWYKTDRWQYRHRRELASEVIADIITSTGRDSDKQTATRLGLSERAVRIHREKFRREQRIAAWDEFETALAHFGGPLIQEEHESLAVLREATCFPVQSTRLLTRLVSGVLANRGRQSTRLIDPHVPDLQSRSGNERSRPQRTAPLLRRVMTPGGPCGP